MNVIIKSTNSGRFIVAVGATGFKHTTDRNKATQFPDAAAALAFVKEHGLMWPCTLLQAHEVKPLSKLEQFVWDNKATDSARLATMLNRTVSAVEQAEERAARKVAHNQWVEEQDELASASQNGGAL